jgi:sulfur carrier protein ThiS
MTHRVHDGHMTTTPDLTIMDLVNESLVHHSARVAEVNGERVIALTLIASNGGEVQIIAPLDTADDIMRLISETLACA